MQTTPAQGTVHTILKTVMEILEEEGVNILKLLVSNRLVANPSKTKFMLLNNKDKEEIRTIKVGTSNIQ